jgi:hypothetical protein
MNLILATQLSACATSVDGAMVPGMASELRPDHPKLPDLAAPGHVCGKGDTQETTKRGQP